MVVGAVREADGNELGLGMPAPLPHGRAL